MSAAEAYGNLSQLALTVIAVPTFVIGLMQYRSAQRWKRVEFLAGEAKKFFSDPVNKKAMKMLDWNGRPIIFDKPDGSKQVEIIDWNDLAIALRPGTDDRSSTEFDELQVELRDIFWDFFDALSDFEIYIKTGVVSEKEVKPYVIYWVHHINEELSGNLKTSILGFLECYGYQEVLDLLKRYKGQSGN
jgi:hypothetical protein